MKITFLIAAFVSFTFAEIRTLKGSESCVFVIEEEGKYSLIDDAKKTFAQYRLKNPKAETVYSNFIEKSPCKDQFSNKDDVLTFMKKSV